MKKLISIALVLIMGICIYTIATATPSMSNFTKVNSYRSGQFTDVNENQWYGYNQQKVIATAYEYGLVNGTSTTTFNPTGNITVAEAVTLAARVHSIYNGGNGEFTQGNPWYQVYVDYAIENNITTASDFTNYTRAATRSEMVYVFSRSVPSAQFTSQNTVNSLPDVGANTPYSESILMLYRAGILTGSNASGTFNPGSNITRAEAAAIISRIILPDTRTIGRTYGNTTVDDGIVVSIWELESMSISGRTISEEDKGYLFPEGLPYLWFDEGNTVRMFNFHIEYDSDSNSISDIVELGTYTQSGNSISITDSEGIVMTLSRDGDTLIWQTDSIIMRFRLQWAAD